MRFEVLTEDDIERVDSATMTILNRTGVAIYERQSQEILESEGASVDRARSVVRIPERIIRDAMEKVPNRFRLAARDRSRSIELGSGRTYFTNSATGIRVLDHKTGNIRESRLSDIPTFARVADALKNINFYGPTVVAHDVKGELHFLEEMVAAIENTSKHVAHESQGTELTKRYVRIAQIVAGGEEELRKNPVVSAGGCPVSPLQFDRANTEAMLECARGGMPFDVLSMAMGGGTSPITLAGELAIINAEVLTGVALCELSSPGCPVIYGSVASVMDMRTGILALGAPERGILNAAVAQMARHYGIPSLVGGISTDGKLPGDQTMLEKTITGLPSVLAGADIVFGPAVLNSAKTYSVEQLVIDDEVAGTLTRIAQGMAVDDEALAVDLIDKVGPGGAFIGTKHTLEHLRKDVWMPELADRNIAENWMKLGAKDMRAKAKEKVDRILSEHRVEPLEKEQKKEIDQVLKAAPKSV
ncbi:MAG: [trimethylamine--corrinoid protein] Co-methyltransferase [Thermoplasmata archaeon]